MANECKITINEPRDNETFYTGTAVLSSLSVKGEVSYPDEAENSNLYVAVNGVDQAISFTRGGYQATITNLAPGNFIEIKVGANCKVENPNGRPPYKYYSDKKTINIHVVQDLTPPTVTIEKPVRDESISITEDRGSFELKVRAQDIGLGVEQLEWNLDGHAGGNFVAGGADLWVASVGWLPRLRVPGQYSIGVRALDKAGNWSELTSVPFSARDPNAPYFEIRSPLDGFRIAAGQEEFRVEGAARDKQSGLAKLEWSLDGGTAVLAKTWDPPVVATADNDKTDWVIDVPASHLSLGKHALTVYFTDDAGNRTTITSSAVLNFEVLRVYQPKNIHDLLSPREYLQQLLQFASNHINTEKSLSDPAKQVTIPQLEELFHHPFSELAEGTGSDPQQGTRPINQLRAVIEVLRRYWDTAYSGAKPDETNYRLAAYRALLLGIGTSYDEIRLVRGEPERRKALAERLGFPEKNSPDCIENLFISPEQITDKNLSELFGLGVVGVTPMVLLWRREKLEADWLDDDKEHFSVPGSEIPLIDPDLIDEGDLPLAMLGNAAFSLFTNRSLWLTTLRGDLAAYLQDAAVGPNEKLQKLLNKQLQHGEEDFLKLAEKADSGADISATLRGWRLTSSGFRRLVGILKLSKAAQTVITDSEWDDVLDIVLRAKKLEQFSTWRQEETVPSPPIVLKPGVFKVAESPKVLNRWLADQQTRLEWQDLLRSRTDIWNGAESSLNATVAHADEQTLPLLRDAIVKAVATKRGDKTDDAAAEWLTANLLVDARMGSAQQTTRVFLAVETLQSLLFALRTNQLDSMHPAYEWRLAHIELDPIGEKKVVETPIEHFDEEWKWMGGYDSWRGARLVFYYPENLLLPSLRPSSEQSSAFRDFVSDLRSKGRVTPPVAREAVRKFQLSVNGLVADFSFANGSGDSCRDASQFGHLAYLRDGAKWGAGDLCGSVDLPVGARVDIPHSDALALGKDDRDFSIVFEVFPRSGPSAETVWYPLLVKESEAWGNPGYNRTPGIWFVPQTKKLHCRLSTTADNNEGINESKGELALNTWTLVKYEKQERRLRLSLNGQLDSEATLMAASVANTQTLRLYGDCAIRGLKIFSASQSELDALFDDELNDTELDLLTTQSKNAFAKFGDSYSAVPSHIKELYYFVPMEAALRLQKSREYVAALAWFRAVYAYDRGPAKRKIYRLLALENNDAAVLSESPHWLQEDINPHVTASLRLTLSRGRGANPYTRFTLMSLVRCLLEFGDAEFTRDTGESIVRARNLYLTARRVLAIPDLNEPALASPSDAKLPNPILDALRTRVELQIAKLREGRNVAGLKRQLEMPASQSVLTSDMPQIGAGGQLVIPGAHSVPRPTPYRFSVLIDRSKHLVNIAQQIESAFLSALEKRDKENFDRMQAGYGLQLAQATEDLQKTRFDESQSAIKMADSQVMRAGKARDTYQTWIDEGLNSYEETLLGLYIAAAAAKIVANSTSMSVSIAQASMSVAGAGMAAPAVAAAMPAFVAASFANTRVQEVVNMLEGAIQVTSLYATQERRKEEWELQKSLSNYDVDIAEVQKKIAEGQKDIAKQEHAIARIHAAEARAVVDFLSRKFTNAELYDWMTRILGEVYSFFLQQATAVAQLAQEQLSFERQEPGLSFIQSDYWQGPNEAGEGTDKGPDRQGLTGSARLLQDIYRMDQFAFETDRRKLNLTHTISLAHLAPFEFQRFRASGILPFRTTMDLFDQAFPGHYMRLIKRVRVSVVALIPPQLGIRGTLRTAGGSWVVTGGDLFARKQLPPRSDVVALTSPVNATGVFELDTQSEMLLPFEGMGVDTSWQFELPKPANPFDFDSIADVLLSIDYAAFHSDDYRGQVVRTLDPLIRAERAFSLKNDFPDQWYELNNPEQQQEPFNCAFELSNSDFPPNIDGLRMEGLLCYFVPVSDAIGEVKIASLRHVVKSANGETEIGGEATTDESGIARYDSRDRPRGATGNWKSLINTSPIGRWKLSLDRSTGPVIKDGKLDDILFVVRFAGRGPDWPGNATM
jgi:hypothetical protein